MKVWADLNFVETKLVGVYIHISIFYLYFNLEKFILLINKNDCINKKFEYYITKFMSNIWQLFGGVKRVLYRKCLGKWECYNEASMSLEDTAFDLFCTIFLTSF